MKRYNGILFSFSHVFVFSHTNYFELYAPPLSKQEVHIDLHTLVGIQSFSQFRII